MKDPFDISRWTITNKTAVPVAYSVTGIAFSPIRQNIIVLYTKLPDEVESFDIRRRQSLLDKFGIVEDPNESVEDDYPLIIVNKYMRNHLSMRDLNKYSFYRNFKNYTKRRGIDIENPFSARASLIGATIHTNFIQMRKLNTDVRFWAPDRVGITIS